MTTIEQTKVSKMVIVKPNINNVCRKVFNDQTIDMTSIINERFELLSTEYLHEIGTVAIIKSQTHGTKTKIPMNCLKSVPKTANEIYSIDDELEMEIIESTNSKIQNFICRTSEGIVAIIRFKKGVICRLNSVWRFKVVKLNEKSIVVEPLLETVDQQTNRFLTENAIKSLATPKQSLKSPKMKVNYPYMSNQEILKNN